LDVIMRKGSLPLFAFYGAKNIGNFSCESILINFEVLLRSEPIEDTCCQLMADPRHPGLILWN